MSRELLKEIAEVFRERRGGITWAAEPLLGKIETELAKPEPEPVLLHEDEIRDCAETETLAIRILVCLPEKVC